jgi:threonine/homoserine/homoserine lactone efflux protein
MEITNWMTSLTAGTVLGLSAGISPGPLLALVISETLKHGKKEGIKISLSPLITDLPVILFSLLAVSLLARSHVLLAVIGFLGGAFVAWLGIECLTTRGLSSGYPEVKPRSLTKGIIANLLNPHPYLFWIAVGAPLVMKAQQAGTAAVAAFFSGFYICLVGSKIIIALLTGKSKGFLNNKTYIRIMRILGLTLLVFAALFIFDGIKRLNPVRLP